MALSHSTQTTFLFLVVFDCLVVLPFAFCRSRFRLVVLPFAFYRSHFRFVAFSNQILSSIIFYFIVLVFFVLSFLLSISSFSS